MNKLPNFNLSLQMPEKGFAYKVDLDLNLFLPAPKETFGIELKSVVIPLLLKLVRMKIRDLELDRELKRLTKESELELINQQEQEQNLTLWLNEINHEYVRNWLTTPN